MSKNTRSHESGLSETPEKKTTRKREPGEKALSRNAGSSDPDRQRVNPLPIKEAGSVHPETGRPACMGRNRRSATYCKNEPGFGTDHLGIGRCKFHAGSVPNMTKRHRYESAKFGSRVQELFDAFRDDPQPHNMLNELALLRAITVDYVERHEQIMFALYDWATNGIDVSAKGKPPELPDLITVRKIIADIGAMIERMHRIEQRGLISIQAFKQAFEQVGVVLATEIDDPDALARIEKALSAIKIPNSYKARSLSEKRKLREESVSPDERVH